MGIRTDQVMGLNEWAQKFVAGEEFLAYTERVTRIYPDGHEETLPERPVHESSVRKEEADNRFYGMYETEYPLHRYAFPDGRVFCEQVQADPWSSGPVFFLALQDERGTWVQESLWPEEEIENA